MTLTAQQDIAWPLWRNIIFRFLFIYLFLIVAPWTWVGSIPGISSVIGFYYKFIDWIVTAANKNFFHIHSDEIHGPVGGSGDTSQGWAEMCLFLIIAFVGCIILVVARQKEKELCSVKLLAMPVRPVQFSIDSLHLWNHEIVWFADGISINKSISNTTWRFIANAIFMAFYRLLLPIPVLFRFNGMPGWRITIIQRNSHNGSNDWYGSIYECYAP
ncbi:MAG TPA: hypothetical protein VF622_01975 [Segetibacter sp.]|jgi:hypothetical protein